MIDGAMAVTILKAKEGKDREEGTSRIDHVVVETDRVKELAGIQKPTVCPLSMDCSWLQV